MALEELFYVRVAGLNAQVKSFGNVQGLGIWA